MEGDMCQRDGTGRAEGSKERGFVVGACRETEAEQVQNLGEFPGC